MIPSRHRFDRRARRDLRQAPRIEGVVDDGWCRLPDLELDRDQNLMHAYVHWAQLTGPDRGTLM